MRDAVNVQNPATSSSSSPDHDLSDFRWETINNKALRSSVGLTESCFRALLFGVTRGGEGTRCRERQCIDRSVNAVSWRS